VTHVLNIALTPTAEALLQQLIRSGDEHDSAVLIEQALQYFCDRGLDIDNTIGFPDQTETEIIQENEQRWNDFQETEIAHSHEDVVKRFERFMGPIGS
jgi:uncharacterized protein (DUF924 family)